MIVIFYTKYTRALTFQNFSTGKTEELKSLIKTLEEHPKKIHNFSRISFIVTL